ncbi:MAG: response regulator, partial [Elusimicrobiota bacterium]
MQPDELLTSSQVCQILSITRPTLYHWIKERRLRPWKVIGEGSTHLFLRTGLELKRLKKYSGEKASPTASAIGLAERAIANILIYTHDRTVNDRIMPLLKAQGCHVVSVKTPLQLAHAIHRSSPEIMVLDLDLTQDASWEILAGVKEAAADPGALAPAILILSSSESTPDDAARALKQGAWDFIRKPIVDTVFLARFKWTLKRRLWTEMKPSQGETTIESHDNCLTLDPERRLLEIRSGPNDKQSIVAHLTPKELGLLSLFLQRPGRIFSKQLLLEIVWGYAA